MRCASCGTIPLPSHAFCEACGASLKLECPACGHPIRPESRFCGQCGTELDRGPGAEIDTRQLLRALSASGGEYKRLTILFADIRDSTRLIDSLGDPELAMRQLDPLIASMKEAVHRFGGIVNKVQGDGVMALFGAPQPHEDHAVRGCLAALEMHDAISRHDSSVRIRIGIHTGDVVVQAVQNSIYQTYDASGVNVHLAKRVEEIADGGGTVVTKPTYAEAMQFVTADALGTRSIRGISAPIELFKLTGLVNARASNIFRGRGRLNTLIGRGEQIAALDNALHASAAGDGRVVGIVGEAGVGKSRLSFEFAESCRHKGIQVYEARVLAHGRATPFQPVLELLRDVFQLHANDPPDQSRQRITDLLKARGNCAQYIPVVLDFMGLQDPARSPSKQDASVRKHRLLAFVREFVRTRPGTTPTIIVVEDLHWIDKASEEYVEALVEAVAGSNTMLLLNFRPDYRAPWMKQSHYREISVEPLEGKQAQELLAELLGADSSLSRLSDNISERAQGNPFFLEELVQSLVEHGDFEGQLGAYRLRGDIEASTLPPTVQAVVAARIDGLPDRLRRTLQSAAVIGREFSTGVLQHVSDLTSQQASDILSLLQKAKFVHQLPPTSRGMYAFRHPLIQEVAYQSLLKRRRRELHRRVAQAIALQFGEPRGEHEGLIAFHLEQAGDRLPAAQAHARSALWLGARDRKQVLATWMRVRELLVELPSAAEVDYLRMMACGQIVNFGWSEGLSEDQARTCFEEANKIALASGNLRASAMLHAGFGRASAGKGSADRYVENARKAVELAKETGDASLEVLMKASLSHALVLAGRLKEALALNNEASRRADEINKFHRQLLGFDVEPWLTALLGQLLVTLGRGDDARSSLDRVIQMDAELVNMADHIMPSISYVDLAWARGDVLLAEHHSERAFSMASQSGSPYFRTYATASRGLSHIVAGRFGSAAQDLTTALDLCRQRQAGLEYESRILAHLSEAYRRQGNLNAALDAAKDAIVIGSQRGARTGECLAHIMLGHALIELKDRSRATDEADRAEVLIEETGARLFARVQTELKSKLALQLSTS